MLLLLAALATVAPAAPGLSSADELGLADLDNGRLMLADKNADGAAMLLAKCAERGPSATIEADCQWELGWAKWLMNDWEGVVTAWTRVQALDPAREGLDDYLTQAQDQINLQQLLASSRDSAPATFASTAPEGATLRLRAVGDMMIGTTFPAGYLPPDDGVSTFSDVSDWLSDADITFGNLEGPLCDGGKTTKCKPDSAPGSCYAFRTPTHYGQYYKDAGFDLLSTANNHASDFGATCRTATEETLVKYGIHFSGRPGTIASLEHNGLQVAMIGFHSNRSGHYLNDHDTAAALIADLASRHDIVIVSFHGGAEGPKNQHVPQGSETYYGENRGSLRTFARLAVDAGADIVIGHGPHVLRGMEVYNDRLIAYSLGNFATYGRFNTSGVSGVGLVLEANLDKEGRFVGGLLLPTKQVGEGVPMKDPEGQAIDLIRTLSAEDFPGTAVAVAQDGSLAAP